MKRTAKNKMITLLGAMLFIFVSVTAALPLFASLISPVAIFSAVMNMPEGSLYALQEQLRAQQTPSPQEAQETPPTQPPAPAPSSTPSPIEFPETPEYSEEPSVVPSPVPIPAAHQGRISAEDLSGLATASLYRNGQARLKNYTDYTTADLDKILKTPMKIKLANTDEPQVFIYHTHATESYTPYDDDVYDKRNNWRTCDNNNNMVAVGAVLADTLRQNGIGVLHDTSQHDYPSYDGSYQNSYNAIKQVLKEHPSIKVVLDLHRDAIERDGSVIVKPVLVAQGEKYAQVMIISNCDDGSRLIPEWRENLRFAVALADQIEQQCEGLTRPILFSHRKYNQQLSTGALLVEFGAIGNTIDEAKRSAVVVGEALSELLHSTRK